MLLLCHLPTLIVGSFTFFVLVLLQMKKKHQLEDSELKKVVNLRNISVPACFATAGTSLIIGSVSAC